MKLLRVVMKCIEYCIGLGEGLKRRMMRSMKRVRKDRFIFNLVCNLIFNCTFSFTFSFMLALGFFLPQGEAAACTVEIKMKETIGLYSLYRLERGLEVAQKKSCGSLLILINTPGGSLQSTRKIVEGILNSPIPILCLVHPSGGHAGSAGAIILQSCHVVGAMEATNIGAATPISGSGQSMSKDLRKKMINDVKSWLEGIAQHRDRSQKFAQEIVTEAKAVSSQEALKLKAIDFVASTKVEFLEWAHGRQVKMVGKEERHVVVGPLHSMEEGLRDRAISFITDPQMAYMMMMASLGLLYFEITHPGTIVPGVMGGVGLLVSLVSLHKMDVTWGGVALIFLGLALLLVEAFVPSFGTFGIGGISSFVIGSLFLFDPEVTGIHLSIGLIVAMALLLGLVTLGIAFMAYQTRHIKKQGGGDELLHRQGQVIQARGWTGLMEIHGEIWKFKCGEKVDLGDSLRVESYKGLTLVVSKVD